jgi:hypothetical protein
MVETQWAFRNIARHYPRSDRASVPAPAVDLAAAARLWDTW